MIIQTGVAKTSKKTETNFQFVIESVEYKNPSFIVLGNKDKKKYGIAFTQNEFISFLNKEGITSEKLQKSLNNYDSLIILATGLLKEKEYIFQAVDAVNIGLGVDYTLGSFVSGAQIKPEVPDDLDPYEPVMQRIPFRPFKVPYFGPNPRIGYSNLPIPINAVQISRQSDYDEIPIIRSQGTVKKGTGYSYESYNVTYVVDGPEQIQTGIVDVLNLVNLTPFISAEGSPFSALSEGSVIIKDQIGDIPYTAFAVKSYSVSTSPGMPNQLIVSLSLEPFNYQYYVPPFQNERKDTYYNKYPRINFDDMICWPLVKLWAKSRSKFVSDSKLNGRLGFYFLNKQGQALLQDALDEDLTKEFRVEDDAAFETLISLISNTRDKLISTNAAEIKSTLSSNKMFLGKFNNQNSWRNLVNDPKSFVKGLVEWKKVETKVHNTATLSSNQVDYGVFLTNQQGSANTFKKPSAGTANIIDVSLTGNLNTNINNYFMMSLLGTLTPPAPNTTNYELYHETIVPLIKSAQDRPWVYFSLLFEIKDAKQSLSLQTKLRSVQKAVAPKIQTSSFSGRLKNNVLTAPNTKEFLLDTVTDGDVIIEQISGSKGFTLGLKTMQVDPLPLHEYLGGTDTTIVIQGKCIGSEGKRKLSKVKETYDQFAVLKTSDKFNIESRDFGKFSALLGVDNELFEMLGVDFIIPINIEFVSIDGEPNVWGFSLTCLEHNLANLQQEKIKFLDTEASNLARILNYDANGLDRSTINPTVASAVEYISMVNRLSKEEVYADMQLPTYSELHTWINSLRRIAKAWKAKENSLKASNSTSFVSVEMLRGIAKTYNLTEYDLSVANTCKEFFEYDYTKFLEWEDPKLPEGTPRDAYVDPDFYCYYEDHDDWKRMVDFIAEREYGPRKGLEAQPRTSNVSFEVNRKRHTELGDITTVYPPNSTTNNAADIATMYETVRDRFVYPVLDGQEVKKKIDERDKKFDTKAGEKSWWGSGSYLTTERQGKKEFRVVKTSESDILKYLTNNPAGLIQPAPEGDESGVRADATQQGFTAPLANKITYEKDFLKLLNGVGYRLELLNKFQLKGQQLGTPFTIQLSGLSQVSVVSGSSTATDRKWIPATVEIENAQYDFENDSRKAAIYPRNKPFGDQEYNNLLDAFPLQDSNWNFTYLNTIKLNSNFTAIFNGDKKVDLENTPTRGDANHLLTRYEDYFAKYGIEHGVDPTVVKSILLRREALGTKTEGSITQELFTQEKLSPEIFRDRIKLISKLYAEGLKRYELPSLAIVYVETLINPTEAKKYTTNGVLSDEINTRLVKLKDKYRTNKFGKGALELARDLKSLGNLSMSLNEYWTAYIEISRICGAYSGSYGTFGNVTSYKTDGFFNNKSPLIVIDIDDNQDVGFPIAGPSGVETTIDMGRTSVNVLSYDNDKSRNINQDRLASNFARSVKYRSAQDPKSEAALYGFLSDMRNYGVHGRLLGAFPTVQTVIINEGFFYVNGSQKLWDQYYTRSGIVDVEVFKSRTNAADTCSITYSNMFHYLSAYALEEAHAESLARRARDRYTTNLAGGLTNGDTTQFFGGAWTTIKDIFNNAVLKNIPEDLVELWQNNRLKQLALHPGARLQVRLGYGSNAAKLPVIFNGTVVSCPLQDGYMTLTAVGDGLELERQITRSLVPVDNGFNYQDSGAFGIGKDPSSIVTEALVGGSLIANLTGGRFGKDDSGVSHFGNIIYGPQGSHKPYETQINIYSSSPTKIEQGIPYIRNYFNVNALYNFDDTNLFSVSVKEPTVWKVANVCANACLDFTTRAEPFAARSTLFFGKWWYPYNYDYHPSIIDLVLTPTVQSELGFKSITEVPTAPEKSNYRSMKPIESLRGVEISDKEGYEGLFETANIITGQFATKYDVLIPFQVVGLFYTGGAVGREFYLVFKKTDSTWVPVEGDATFIAKSYGNEFTRVQKNTKETAEALQVSNQLDLVADVDTLVKYCKSKNYMQAYVISSELNLLENRMTLNSEKIATDAVGVHLENGLLHADAINKTITYHLDNNIISADRKTAVVDTGILLTMAQKGVGRALSQGIFSWVPAINDFVKENPATPAINNSVITGMVKMARDMYDGEIISLFLPTMKPGDMIQFEDLKSSLKGPLLVKEVVHKLNVKTGSMTVIVPDLVAIPSSSIIGLHTFENLSRGLQKLKNYAMYKTASILWRLMANRYHKRAGLQLAKEVYSYNQLEGHYLEDIRNLSGSNRSEVMDSIKKQASKELDDLLKDLGNVEGKETKEALEKKYNQLKQLLGVAEKSGRTDLPNDLRGIDTKELKKIVEYLDANTPGGIADKDLGAAYKTAIELLKNRMTDPDQIFLLIKKMEALGLGSFDLSKLDVSGTKVYQEIFKFRNELDLYVKETMKIIQEGGVPVGITGRSKKDLIVSLEQIINKRKANFYTKLKTTPELWSSIPDNIKIIIQGEQDALKLADQAFAKTGILGYTKNRVNIFTGASINDANKIMANADAVAEYPEQFVDEYIKGNKAIDDTAEALTSATVKDLGGLDKQIAQARTAEAKAKLLELLKEQDSKAARIAKKVTSSKIAKGVAKLGKFDKITDTAINFYFLENKMKHITDVARTVRLLSNCGPGVLFSVAKEVAMFAFGDQILFGVNARIAALHSVILLPLMSTKSSIPYVAGIRGHQGAVVGDSVGWADNLLSGLITGKNGGVGAATAFLGALIGIEEPEWSKMNSRDKKLMQNIYGEQYGNLHHQEHAKQIAEGIKK